MRNALAFLAVPVALLLIPAIVLAQSILWPQRIGHGTAGQVLTASGPSGIGSWQAAASSTPRLDQVLDPQGPKTFVLGVADDEKLIFQATGVTGAGGRTRFAWHDGASTTGRPMAVFWAGSYGSTDPIVSFEDASSSNTVSVTTNAYLSTTGSARNYASHVRHVGTAAASGTKSEGYLYGETDTGLVSWWSDSTTINTLATGAATGAALKLVSQTDCSAVVTLGYACFDSDDKKFYVGDGAAPVLIGP